MHFFSGVAKPSSYTDTANACNVTNSNSHTTPPLRCTHDAHVLRARRMNIIQRRRRHHSYCRFFRQTFQRQRARRIIIVHRILDRRSAYTLCADLKNLYTQLDTLLNYVDSAFLVACKIRNGVQSYFRISTSCLRIWSRRLCAPRVLRASSRT